jgi:hypothetical protein
MITRWNMSSWEAWRYLKGYVRGTGDMDVWVNKTKDNYRNLVKAFTQFGMPVFDMSEKAFLGNEFDVWGIGVQPVRIEIMTAARALSSKRLISKLNFIMRIICKYDSST